MFERILVPLDGSRLSAKAASYALGIAEKFGSEVILLQVVKQTPPVPMAEPAGMMSPVTAQTVIEAAQMQDQSNIANARRYLKRQQKKFVDKGIKASYQVVLGNPTEAILSFYRKQHIDLVVMTTRGRSGIKRAILGSVADAIVREPGGPALVIRM
jgi:nucleotide-binding universal stress UspA family protein